LDAEGSIRIARGEIPDWGEDEFGSDGGQYLEQGDVLVWMSANVRGGFYHEEIGNECQFLNDLLCWKSVQRKSQKSGLIKSNEEQWTPKDGKSFQRRIGRYLEGLEFEEFGEPAG
jgi:hypothetical protein